MVLCRNKSDNVYIRYCTWHIISTQLMFVFSLVQRLSRVRLFATPWTAACQASLSITNSRSPCPLGWWCHPAISSSVTLFSSCPQLTQHQALFSELALLIRWLKYWCFSISPFNEYSGLICFRTDWFDLLANQGILKSLFQHYSSKA